MHDNLGPVARTRLRNNCQNVSLLIALGRMGPKGVESSLYKAFEGAITERIGR